MARPTAIDLFAGAGGMSLGFEQAGFDVIAAVELDPIHCAVHEYNFPDCLVICANMSEISGQDILERAGVEAVDVLFGGPPCQGFSLMGKRLLDDPRNALVSHFIRLVKEIGPRYLVMENVKGMATGKQRQVLGEAIAALEAIGYGVVQPPQVLNAAHYGVPQHRERLFLLGYRQGLTPPQYPEPTTHPARAKRLNAHLSKLPASPTVQEALQDLPNIEQYEALWGQDSVEAEFGIPSQYGAILRGLEVDWGDYSYPRPLKENWLTNSVRSHHRELSIERFRKTKPGEREPVSRFLRLHPQGVCNTLRAGTPSSRGAFTSPRPIHPQLPRCITVREAARLHSYPDWFRFHVTKWHGFRQIGNSVPPWLARAVAQSVRESLGSGVERPQIMSELGDEGLLSLTMTEAAARYGVAADAIAPRRRLVDSSPERVSGDRLD
ncbi:DNA cytosine methyltransferase [Sodalinema gerasimenkoae]|uniref:DNA cytosine methyltransferase n=1 Tax=Sodalinema gerasimenkoae TaxID=2862348 RepID=UPI00135B33A3|nr:DNA cytosine methyltransferase [Sodalinema gerasimenkoae]